MQVQPRTYSKFEVSYVSQTKPTNMGCMPVIPALGKQKLDQEFKASLGDVAGSGLVFAIGHLNSNKTTTTTKKK